MLLPGRMPSIEKCFSHVLLPYIRQQNTDNNMDYDFTIELREADRMVRTDILNAMKRTLEKASRDIERLLLSTAVVNVAEAHAFDMDIADLTELGKMLKATEKGFFSAPAPQTDHLTPRQYMLRRLQLLGARPELNHTARDDRS